MRKLQLYSIHDESARDDEDQRQDSDKGKDRKLET